MIDQKMEIEGSQANKVRNNIVRVLLFMVGKGIAKSRLVMEFHVMMLIKRGKSLLNSLIIMLHHRHHYGAFTCRSHDPNHLSFISPRTTTTDYEFSCSNSPANPFQAAMIKRSKHSRYSSASCQYQDDVSTVSAVQKVLEMLNNEVEASPLVTLPGFGKSPIGRQLRVTDSPFPLKEDDDDDGDSQVDMAAEEFIQRFYKDLNLQNRSIPALDSPYNNYSYSLDT